MTSLWMLGSSSGNPSGYFHYASYWTSGKLNWDQSGQQYYEGNSSLRVVRIARGGGCDQKRKGPGTWPHRTETPTGKDEERLESIEQFELSSGSWNLYHNKYGGMWEGDRILQYPDIITHMFLLWEKHGRKAVEGGWGSPCCTHTHS